MLVIPPSETYNRFMHSAGTIERLLEAANSASDGDTSLNLAKRTFLNQSDCDEFFVSVRSNLFDIGEWNKNSSAADYALFDDAGKSRDAEKIDVGWFIRIGLYGGGKYDWVRVISVLDETDELVITVKPTFDPTEAPTDTNRISHFFSPEATNNFCIQRIEKTIAFYVIGLNEHQNSKFTDGLIESARNVAVANVGYYTGLQKAVWKQFSSNFLKTDEEKES